MSADVSALIISPSRVYQFVWDDDILTLKRIAKLKHDILIFTDISPDSSAK